MKNLSVVVFVLFLSLALSSSSSFATLCDGYDYARTINITNNDIELYDVGHTIFFSVNVSGLVSEGKLQSDADDLLVVFNDTTVLDRLNLTALDSDNVTFAFQTRHELTGTATDTLYKICYGNASATAQTINASNVFDIYMNFDSGVPASCTTAEGAFSTTGGYLSNTQATSRIYCPFSFPDTTEVWMEYDFYIGDPNSHFFYFLTTGTDLNDGNGYNIFTDATNLEILRRHSSGSQTALAQGGALSATTWYTIKATRNESGVWNLYVNNVFENTSVDSTYTASDYWLYEPRGLDSRIDNFKMTFKYTYPEPTVILGAEEEAPADTFPTFNDNQTDGSLAGSTVLHSLLWSDDVGLDSFIFSFDNGVGSFTNDSAIAFGVTGWSNVSKSVNSTIGVTIRWQVFANDSIDQWTASDVYEYLTTGYGTPTVTIFSPTNTTYNASNQVPLNVGADQSISAWTYSLNGGVNQSFTPNTTLTLSNGFYTIDVFAENALAEEGVASVSFTVDYTAPTTPEVTGQITGATAGVVSLIALILGAMLILFITRSMNVMSINNLKSLVIVLFMVLVFIVAILSFI